MRMLIKKTNMQEALRFRRGLRFSNARLRPSQMQLPCVGIPSTQGATSFSDQRLACLPFTALLEWG